MRYHVSCGECFERRLENLNVRQLEAGLRNVWEICIMHVALVIMLIVRLSMTDCFHLKFSWLFQYFTLLNILFITARRYTELSIATAKLSVRPSVCV